MATLRKRGENQWEARVRKTGFPVSCKRFTKKAEAEAWAKMVESEMERGIFVSRKESESTTLEECLHRYEKEIVPALANPKNYVTRINRLVREHLCANTCARTQVACCQAHGYDSRKGYQRFCS